MTKCVLHSIAMGASEEPELLQETFSFLSNKARDQDLFNFFWGISNNFHGRRPLTKYFQDNYDIVSKQGFAGVCWVIILIDRATSCSSPSDLKETSHSKTLSRCVGF